MRLRYRWPVLVADGKVVPVFDGLDEIATSEERVACARPIAVWAGYREGGGRYVATSRIDGQLGELGRYMLHPDQHLMASRGAMGWIAAV